MIENHGNTLLVQLAISHAWFWRIFDRELTSDGRCFHRILSSNNRDFFNFILMALRRRSNVPLCDTLSIDAILNAMPKVHLIGTLLPHASARSVVCGSAACLPVHVYLLLGILVFKRLW